MGSARIYVPNVQLREHRLRLNLTLEEVAEALIALAWERFAVRVGVNAGMVGKWERGEKRPSRFYQRLFVLLYGVPAEQLGFRPAGPSDQAAEDVLVELGAGEGATHPLLPDSAAPGGARLPVPAIATPRRLDPEAVGRLGTILTKYAKIDNLLGPAHLLALTSLHLRFISELLTVAAGDGRAELLTVGARYAEFAGWLHQDAGNLQEAAYWSDRAMGWAEAAGKTSWCPTCSCARATKRPARAMPTEPSGWLGRPCAARIGSRPGLVPWPYARKHGGRLCPAIQLDVPGRLTRPENRRQLRRIG